LPRAWPKWPGRKRDAVQPTLLQGPTQIDYDKHQPIPMDAMNSLPTQIPDLPNEARLDRLVSLLEPFSRVTQPKLYGLDR
jgi:hypothetical protein